MKPSCYPGGCHTCESDTCYSNEICPHCGAELWVCKYDDDPQCSECGGFIDDEPEPETDRHQETSDGLLGYLRDSMRITATGGGR